MIRMCELWKTREKLGQVEFENEEFAREFIKLNHLETK